MRKRELVRRLKELRAELKRPLPIFASWPSIHADIDRRAKISRELESLVPEIIEKMAESK